MVKKTNKDSLKPLFLKNRLKEKIIGQVRKQPSQASEVVTDVKPNSIQKEVKATQEEKSKLDKYIEDELMGVDQFIAFKQKEILPTLLYCSLVFKWIGSDRVIMVVNTVKMGYHLELYLKSFKFNAVFLDPEMPVNTNKHNAGRFLKGQFPICIVFDKYNDNSPQYAKELFESCPIAPEIIYFDVINQELLEYHYTYNTNIKAIYHFINTLSKQEFQRKYNNLPKNLIFVEFKHDQDQVSHLNYRCEDIYNSITKNDIKKAKLKRINLELIKSKNMEQYFKDNPEERNLVLKSIQENQVNTTRPSVSFLPEYLIHEDNKTSVIEQAITKNFGNKIGPNSKKSRKKKNKMEKYLNLLDSQNNGEDTVGEIEEEGKLEDAEVDEEGSFDPARGDFVL